MKTATFSFVAVLALGGLLASCLVASAQEAKEGKERKKGGMTVQMRVDQLDKQLKLTEDQKTKIKALYEADEKKMQEIRELSPEQRREKFRPMREETAKKMKEILTAEQYEKWQKNREQFRQRRPEGAPGAAEKKAERKNKE